MDENKVGVSLTNNNGFWIRWLDLLTLLYNYNQLWQLSINDCLWLNWTESESYVTTDGQPASLSWNKAPIWGLPPDLYYLCDNYSLVLVGRPLWREVGSVFVCAAGPCQRSLSRVRVPWDSRPYFTVSHLRLPFSSPTKTRRVTVEVFDPASTRVNSELNSWMNSLL
jgi:hypothetical protein